jgi:hypothetical protein
MTFFTRKPKIAIKIFKHDGTLVEAFRFKKDSQLDYRYDMLTEVKHLELMTQFAKLVTGDAPSSREHYELYSTYVKFGEAVQQKVALYVDMTKL